MGFVGVSSLSLLLLLSLV